MTAFTTTHQMLAAAGPGFASDKDQLKRAMSSVIRNIAEAAARWTPADKKARFIVARAEAAEAAACLEMLVAIGLVDEALAGEIDRDLDRSAECSRGSSSGCSGPTRQTDRRVSCTP